MAATRRRRRNGLPWFSAALGWLACAGCNGVFFQPDDRLYHRPADFGLRHEEVTFASDDGTLLTGWLLPAAADVTLGTIVHFHGNGANISSHVYSVRWLPARGFSVFLFDYRGYGSSRGSPHRRGAVRDGAAAIDYVRRRPDVDATRLVIYGQSLGGALAVSGLARAGPEGVRALVLEGTFASYREVARLVLDDRWYLWPFQVPLSRALISDDERPAAVLPQLAQVPTLVVHGQRDRIVPIEAGRRLFDAVAGDKDFWPVPEAGHLDVFTEPDSPWRDDLVSYLEARLR